MAKRLYFRINDVLIGYTQKAEISEELSNDTLATFSGPVPDLGGDPSYEVSVDVLRYEGSLANFLEIKKLIRSTRDTPCKLKISEDISFASGETTYYSQVINKAVLTSNKVTYDAETRTVSNLAWKGTDFTEYADGTDVDKL